MFYSQFILAKKGPLGTIWIAAHLERKLRKNQVADTDIGVSVDSILSPEAPIALRMSSHLLLGVVRIYNRKVNYLFDDCSEALLNVKQAFRSTAVDLPPEESKAPYHSITLPENFDLDDFELPDNDIFKSNYVDHHISSREQITLQDSMEGVSYSTSKFGLDERFGDGDASGLDLDEELFLNEIETAGASVESADPQTSYRSMTPLKPDEHLEDVVTNSETMFGAADERADVMDYAQAPSTPGLVEEPNLSNAKNASACEDHMESEYHVMESNMKENDNDNNVPCEDKQGVDWCSRDDTISNIVPVPQGHEENGHLSSVLEIKESEMHQELPTKGQAEDTTPTSEFTGRTKASDVPLQEDLSTEAVKEEKVPFLSVDETSILEKRADETSCVANIDQQVSEGVLVKDQQKSCDVDGSEVASGVQVGSIVEIPETQPCQEITSNLEVHDKEVAGVTLVSGPCNSVLENPDLTKPGVCIETDADGMSDISILETNEREGTTVPGKVFSINSNSDQILKENQVREHASGEDIQVAIINEPGAQVQNTNSQDTLAKNLNCITEPELPAPEKLLSVPEGLIDSHKDMLVEVSPSEFKGLDVIGDTGSKSAVGRKRSFTESTLTEHSLNSVESSRQVRVKRTTDSVPDDDDLLSSILVGRNSSILKVKPTPPLTEVTSMKRTRAVTRSGAPKRKVIVDDTMVLHGDMIRHQLTNTEDIRRVRKKAPCTLAEISMIEKQHKEDEIFLGTIFTGMSVELASLHGQTHGLNLITVCKDDVHVPSLDTLTGSQHNKNDASLETIIESNLEVTDTRLLSQEDKNDASLETIFEPNLASMDDNYAASLETVAVSHLASPHNENHDEGLGLNNVSKISEQVGPDAVNPLPCENRLEEVNYTTIDADFSQEQTKPTDDVGHNDSQREPPVSAAEVEISLINAVTENLSVIPEVDPLDSVQTDSLNEFSERNSHMNMDASSYVVPDQMVSIHSVELDYSADGGEQENDWRKLADKDDVENEFVARDDILHNMVQDAAVEIVLDGTNHGESEHNFENETYNTFEEHIGLGYSHEALVSGLEDGLENYAKNLNQSELYQPNMIDAGISGFDLPDRYGINYSAVGIDTGFLNVDDDELTEMADDHMPDDEETQYTDNSGWSSRTRAVSKYLQTAFVKEAESGKNSLSMDNLLTGKTRKEASRMFFETLVLKTRDYIHVEQPNPYADITIKPRSSLMKSDF